MDLDLDMILLLMACLKTACGMSIMTLEWELVQKYVLVNITYQGKSR